MRAEIIIKSATISIRRNKMRSFLTTLGVIIGVAAVILLTSIGNGLKNMVTEQFESMGSNILFVTPGDLFSEEGGFSDDSMRTGLSNSKLSLKDVKNINKLGDPIISAVPTIEASAKFRYKGKQKSGIVIGTLPDYKNVRSTDVDKGRFISDADVQGKKKVIVIGPKIEEELFPRKNPLGESVTVNDIKFKVIGVTESKGSSSGGMGGPDFDSWSFIPVETAKSALDIEAINFILIKFKSEEDAPKATKMVESVLAKRLDEDDFSVADQSEILETVGEILNAMTAALTGIAAISLVVGGIGIMNIMLVAVTERTKEIGLRKALGAKPNDILIQFLIESALLSSLGGLIGITLGVLGSLAINQVFPALPTLGSILLAFFVSFATGVVFGVVPARKAARLSPIEALRYE